MANEEANQTVPDGIIWSYIHPHPLDGDSECEDEFLSWLPGFLNEPDEEQGIPAYRRDENIALYRRIEEDAEQWLREAMVRLWPLLRDHRFKSVQLIIDIYGFMLNGNSIAGYNSHDSKPELGVYHLILSSNLLHKWLIVKAESRVFSFDDHYSMEHELIHLLDHWQLVKESVYKSSNEPRENLKFVILKFRSEGLAELSKLLQGHYDSVGSVEEAASLFRDHWTACRERVAGMERTDEKTRLELYESYLHYSAGPWLVLDMLRTFEGGWHLEIIEQCLATISRKQAVNHETLLKVLKIALRVDLVHFLEYADTRLLTEETGSKD